MREGAGGAAARGQLLVHDVLEAHRRLRLHHGRAARRARLSSVRKEAAQRPPPLGPLLLSAHQARGPRRAALHRRRVLLGARAPLRQAHRVRRQATAGRAALARPARLRRASEGREGRRRVQGARPADAPRGTAPRALSLVPGAEPRLHRQHRAARLLCAAALVVPALLCRGLWARAREREQQLRALRRRDAPLLRLERHRRDARLRRLVGAGRLLPGGEAAG
mmetsp:Transcript_42170/g.135600  ORF Transcript_42170/g.135600 Transcript_42170/m.135600 type:complete len:223 (+) Transcript_42170:393-1061(+)